MIELCIPRYDSKHLYGIYSHAETKDLIYERINKYINKMIKVNKKSKLMLKNKTK